MSAWRTLQDYWQQRSSREQLGLGLTGLLLLTALIWWALLQPALQTLREAPQQAAQLDQQLESMLAMQAQAQDLKNQPKLSREDAVRALEASVKNRLPASAQLSVQNNTATLTFKGISADSLLQWLAQARINAHALPSDTKLDRSPTLANAGAAVTWDGRVTLTLP